MSTAISQQYAFRAQKSQGLSAGVPDYVPAAAFQPPEGVARMYRYSSDGRLFALAMPSGVFIYQAESATLVQQLSIPNVIEINFSPRGTYISTWERHVKLEDGEQHRNLRVFSVSTGEQLTAFTQKGQSDWDLQYTISESHAIRLSGPEIQVFSPADWSKGVVDKLKVEGATSVALSPGLNPSVAVFVGEKKGAPASIKVYGLLTLNGPPTCQKSFYKADRAQIKWNTLGTQVLLLTQTDVDAANKSYYGETGLYLLSAAGNFDCRVTLDKEGPIHDFNWNPNSKEFGVVYGFMPAKTVIFDQRVRTLHDFGSAPVNFILFNPQGRLVALAGFGNLAGKINIYDRRTLSKVCTIDAPNTSHCEWSPDGRCLLTATLSPRLRVDNGIRLWHCTGTLLHVQMVEELYQASWRPALLDTAPPFPQALPPAPEPSPSVKDVQALAKPTPEKPVGAYRPPGARGTQAPMIFRREDEGGAARSPSNGLSPHSRSGSPNRGANGRYSRSPGPNGKRHVPGAPPPKSPPVVDGDKKGQANRKRKGGKDKGQGVASGAATPVQPPSPAVDGESKAPGKLEIRINGQAQDSSIFAPSDADAGVPPTPGEAGLDPIAKKVRNLNKKLKAIEELKEKAAKGERLEATQVKKIDSEAEIRKELVGLVGSS